MPIFNRTLIASISILSFLLCPLLASADDEKALEKAKPALTVTAVRPQLTSIPQKLSANGNIAAWQEAIIGSEANGLRLNHVLVNVGDVVRKGQLLADFADETIQADLAQSRASMMEAEATGKEAISNAERARSLQNTGAMSNQQIEQYTTAADTAKARIEVARAAVHSQQLRLKNTKIMAPDSGVISSRSATVGAVVGAGSEMFRLIRQSRLEWRAEIISSDLPKIKAGMKANIIAADGAVLTGTVRKISPTVDTQTRNTLVYVDIPSHSSVKAGMFAKGEFMMSSSSTLAIPQQAIVLRDGFSYVFAIENNHAKQTKIKLGRRLGNMVEVVSGLTPEQAIVASGGAFLSDNDLLKVVGNVDAKKPEMKAPVADKTATKNNKVKKPSVLKQSLKVMK
jgi:HlyD family secretion protein